MHALAHTTVGAGIAITLAMPAVGCMSSSQMESSRRDTGAHDASDGRRDDGEKFADAAIAHDAAMFAVCPDGLRPTYESIHSTILATSCGTDGTACHSSAGAENSGELDLSADPYAALLGPDGQGAPASNIAGSARDLKRVAPGDPDHSFLVIKLTTKVRADPDYGSGMPWPTPGSVCPAALDAVRAWIAAGAER